MRRKVLLAAIVLVGAAAVAGTACCVVRVVGVGNDKAWVMVSGLATGFYALTFVIAVLYAVGQVKEARMARNAELFLRVHESLSPRLNLRVWSMVQDLEGKDVAAFKKLPPDQQDMIMGLCFDATMMGRLLRRGYLDRGLVLDWCAPYMAHVWDCLARVISGLRADMPDIFESFEYLADEGRRWEAKHRREIHVTFPAAEQ